MRPPYCAICPRNLHDDVPEEAKLDEYFTLILFRDYSVPKGPAWALPERHPDGADWFCWEHAAAAEELSHMRSDEAIDLLRERFSAD